MACQNEPLIARVFARSVSTSEATVHAWTAMAGIGTRDGAQGQGARPPEAGAIARARCCRMPTMPCGKHLRSQIRVWPPTSRPARSQQRAGNPAFTCGFSYYSVGIVTYDTQRVK